ncbi:MAG TPA: T9SS type A sorting domain-containing protein [Bacteroidales bacterium]|nr:T9SS type A sorting domain-containing protein [Bacteroidales bacterium]HSA43726.1 T9SS type A sorting domain-containing protein [Bacteroidales bacterium]
MKKRYTLIIWTSALVMAGAIVVSAFSPTGAPAGYTGSPGDGQNCTSCHGGTATNVNNWISSNIPPSGYVPGQTYQITATNNHSGSAKFGFQVSPQSLSGTLMGTLTAGTNNKLVGNNKYVTHMLANNTDNVWTFDWTAPVAGSGTVTFYGAFARGNPGPVALSTLAVTENTTGIENQADYNESFRLYPNPAADHVNLHLPSGTAGPVSIRVSDLRSGIKVLEQTILSGNSHRLDCSMLPKGIYAVDISTETGTISEKLILQ